MHPHENNPNLRLLADLLQIPSPSGREERMAAEIRRRISGLGYEPHQDAQGNVWVQIPGRDSALGPVALASHTDELAVVVTAIEPDGGLCIRPSGGLYPWKLGECPVQILGDGPDPIPAHLSFGSTHTRNPDDIRTQFASGARGITWPHCRLLTGLSPDQLKTAGIRVGATAVPVAGVRGPHLLGPPDDPLVSAWILDNRGGSLSLLRLLEKIRESGLRPTHTVHLCFMVQEETGLIGARGWATRNPVETFIAVDSSPIPAGSQVQIDGRPAAWSRDSTLHFDQRLIRDLAAASDRAGTELQYAVYDGAASDASGVYAAGLAPRAATVGYPRENSHGYEVSRLRVFDTLTDTLLEYLSAL